MNAQLDKGGKPTINNLKTDLCDGVRLLYLLVRPPETPDIHRQEIDTDCCRRL